MISKYNKCYGKKQGNFLRNLDKNYFSNIIGLDNDNDLLYNFNIFVYKKGILGINEPSCHLVNEDWTISLFISLKDWKLINDDWSNYPTLHKQFNAWLGRHHWCTTKLSNKKIVIWQWKMVNIKK